MSAECTAIKCLCPAPEAWLDKLPINVYEELHPDADCSPMEVSEFGGVHPSQAGVIQRIHLMYCTQMQIICVDHLEKVS